MNQTNSETSDGDSGDIKLTVVRLLELFDANISSSTWSEGDAGDIFIHAGQMRIDDNNSSTGISSRSEQFSLKKDGGNAGSVEVSVDGLLELLNNSTISSSSLFGGNAGNVKVSASELMIDGGQSAYISVLFRQRTDCKKLCV